MTRHYTHVSEIAAASAVNGLPVILGNVPAPELPPTRLKNIEQIRALVDKLNEKNVCEVKEKLLATLDAAVIAS
jgi:hypothetical protein